MRILPIGVSIIALVSCIACGSAADDSRGTAASAAGSGSIGAGSKSGISGATVGSNTTHVAGSGNNAATGNSSATGNPGSGTSATGNPASGTNDPSTGATSTGTVRNACAQVSGESRAGVSPPVIEFVLDNTDSMSDTSQPSTKGKSKWAATQQAFTNALPTLAAQHPEYAVGLTYFHYKGYGVGSNGCTDALQAVAVAPLGDAQVNAIISSVKSEGQIQKTPTQDIWQFAADHVLNWNGGGTYAASNRYVVILTDGVPTVAANCAAAEGCSSTTTAGGRNNQSGGGSALSVSVAQYQTFIDVVAKYLSTKRLTTFMVAIPGAEATDQVTCSNGILYQPIAKMQEVAKAGGSSLIDLTTSATTDFTAALVDAITRQIGGGVTSVVNCEYAVPEPPTDPNGNVQFVDPKQVAVWYYSAGGASCTSDAACGSAHCSPATAKIPNRCYTLVPRSIGCADPNGWDYLDAQNKTIGLCSNTCSTAQADSNARVEITIGCFEVG